MGACPYASEIWYALRDNQVLHIGGYNCFRGKALKMLGYIYVILKRLRYKLKFKLIIDRERLLGNFDQESSDICTKRRLLVRTLLNEKGVT